MRHKRQCRHLTQLGKTQSKIYLTLQVSDIASLQSMPETPFLLILQIFDNVSGSVSTHTTLNDIQRLQIRLTTTLFFVWAYHRRVQAKNTLRSLVLVATSIFLESFRHDYNGRVCHYHSSFFFSFPHLYNFGICGIPYTRALCVDSLPLPIHPINFHIKNSLFFSTVGRLSLWKVASCPIFILFSCCYLFLSGIIIRHHIL